LPNNPGNIGAGAFGQCFQFVERFFAADSRLGTKFDPNQDSALVILVNNVVRLSQVITSIAAKSTIQPIRYRFFLTLGAGVTPAQGSVKPTVGFTLDEVNVPYFNSTAPGARICSSSATKVSVGVTR
jgi:hypothetical protein